MKRADQLEHRPARRSVSTRDSRWLARRAESVNRSPDPALLDVLEMSRVTRRILEVAVELTLMMPRSVLGEFVEQLIERMDRQEGDPNLEPDDDREPEDWHA